MSFLTDAYLLDRYGPRLTLEQLAELMGITPGPMSCRCASSGRAAVTTSGRGRDRATDANLRAVESSIPTVYPPAPSRRRVRAQDAILAAIGEVVAACASTSRISAPASHRRRLRRPARRQPPQ